jgi:multiple sugar transport system substrate-binding protein
MERRTLLKGLVGLSASSIAATVVTPAAAQAAVTLSVTHCFPGHDKFHAEIADAFMKANPSIKINFTNSPPTYEEGHSLLLRQMVTNQLPDVYYSGFHLLPPLSRQLLARKQMTTMDAFLAAEGAEWRRVNYSDRILDLGNFDGKQMAMPFNTSTPIVYFNEELVKKAGGDPASFPNNWTDLFALAAKIEALSNDIDGMFMAIHTDAGDWFWQSLVYSNGGELMDPTDTKVAFGDTAGLAALTLTRRFVTDAKMKMREVQQGTQQFYAGKTGIIFQSTASMRATTDSVGSTFTLRTSKFPMADKEKGRLPTGGNALVILTTDEAKAKAAWEFAKWVSGPHGQNVAVRFSGYMPTSLRAEEKQYLGEFYEKNPNYTTTLGQIPIARKWYGYSGVNSNKIINAQKDTINLAMRGDLAVPAALKQMVDQTQSMLPKIP